MVIISFSVFVWMTAIREIPFFSLPRLIVVYKEERGDKEVFFEFADKEEMKNFCHVLNSAGEKREITFIHKEV